MVDEIMSITADYAKGSRATPVINAVSEVTGLVCSMNSIYQDKENGRGISL